MTDVYEMELQVQKQVFYAEDKMFGIYAVDTVEYNKEIARNKYGNFSIQGNTRKLAEGEKYRVKFEGTFNHPKFGQFYKIVSVETEKLDTESSQDKFLKEIVSEKQFDTLKRAYPNEKLVDLIMADKVDTKKTKGIKTHTLEVIKGNIEKNMHLGLLIAKLSDLEISPNKLNKILEHFENDADKAIQAIDSNIYSLCDIRTFGFKTIDEIALKRGDNPEGRKRIEASIKYQLNFDTGDGHTWSMRNHLLSDASDLLTLNMRKVEEVLNKMSESFIYQKNDTVALKHIFNQEKKLLENLLRIHKAFTPPNIKDIEFKIKETEVYQGFSFTEEQRKAIVEGSQEGVMILNGLAGSGKSATVKGLIDSLGTHNYMTAALSGKAVNVLSQRGIEASTIHRMLGFKDGGFEFNQSNPLPYDVVVLDEVSMINTPLILNVVSAVRNGTKLIIVGDSGQLPAIGYGDVLRDLLATDLFPKFELTQVHRQAAKSGILSLANSIRKGNQVFPYDSSGKETYGELQDQTVISYQNKDSIVGDLLNIARAYQARVKQPEDLYEFQVIVSNKERGNLSVKSLNIQLQAIFNDLQKPSLNRNGYEYREDDKIITQGNAYKKYRFDSISEHDRVMNQLENSYFDNKRQEEAFMKPYLVDFFNGTLGYIDTIDTLNKRVFIRLDGFEGVIPLSESELDKIEMAYAATVHKLQGSSINNVIFALDYGAYKLLSKQLVYTAMTRTAKKGVALVENNAMHKAISTDASGLRRTFLADMIQESIAVKS